MEAPHRTALRCENVKGTVPYCMVPVRYLVSMYNTSTGNKSEPFVISEMAVVA